MIQNPSFNDHMIHIDQVSLYLKKNKNKWSCFEVYTYKWYKSRYNDKVTSKAQAQLYKRFNQY